MPAALATTSGGTAGRRASTLVQGWSRGPVNLLRRGAAGGPSPHRGPSRDGSGGSPPGGKGHHARRARSASRRWARSIARCALWASVAWSGPAGSSVQSTQVRVGGRPRSGRRPGLPHPGRVSHPQDALHGQEHSSTRPDPWTQGEGAFRPVLSASVSRPGASNCWTGLTSRPPRGWGPVWRRSPTDRAHQQAVCRAASPMTGSVWGTGTTGNRAARSARPMQARPGARSPVAILQDADGGMQVVAERQSAATSASHPSASASVSS